MPRTYSFDHFTATKPAISVGKRASTQERGPLKSELHSHAGAVHYGHAHSRTEELYKQHRQEHERLEAMRLPSDEDITEEPMGAEAPPSRASEDTAGREAEGANARDGLRGLAQSAVGSVVQAAREAVRGRPLVGARRLAGDAVSGALRVAREVSARTSRSTEDSSGKHKGPGKKD